MKIIVLTNNFGGLYSFRKEVVSAIVDSGHHVTISAPYDEKRAFFEEIGCKLIDTPFERKGMNPIKDIGLIFRYWRILKQEQPDIVLSYTIKPNLYGGIACQLLHLPQLANITGLGTAVENPGWLQKLTIILYRIGLRKATTVFFQNKHNMQFCEEHKMIKSKKVLLPGSGVNLEFHVKKPYPPKEKPIRFIFVGRLLREKGLGVFLAAAEKEKSIHPEVEFCVLGPCEDAFGGVLEDLQSRKIITYFGAKPDVRPYIESSHCTVLPSYYPEGMSNVLLESCAAGRPVITTDRPGCGEIVDSDINGYIVKAKDVDDLVAALEKFINIPYERKVQMGEAARVKVEREFNRQIVIKAYLNEIQNV